MKREDPEFEIIFKNIYIKVRSWKYECGNILLSKKAKWKQNRKDR